MTKIKNYPTDSDVTSGDRVIGTDETGNITKNYTVESLTSFVLPFGFVRYDGTQSFSDGSETTVVNGGSATMIGTDPAPVVSFKGLNVYFTPDGGAKPLFNFNAINQVYLLTVVFKARTSNTNAAHIDLKFSVSGNTSYTRLSKSIDFYKGNNEIQNFHEVFQFYTDQDLVDNGMSLSFDAVGADVDYGDVIYFIQRCI